MEEKEIDLLEMLINKLEDEIKLKEKCDSGELYLKDDWCEDYMAIYRPNPWNDEIHKILSKHGNNPTELYRLLVEFKKHIENDLIKESVSRPFINELSRNIKRITIENIILRDDIVEYVSNLSKEDLENIFGSETARMKDFDQKNIHHCYDLLGHTLHTVAGINPEGLTPEQYKKLRISAFFHDIGKPDVAKFNEKTGQQVFYGHAQKSAEIAGNILEYLGYNETDINEMLFYIGHHDDFISYKTELAPWMKQHEFIREITPETVAEILLENEYNFEKMGYSKDQNRYICYALAHNQNPEFLMQNQPMQIDVDINEVHKKIQRDSIYKINPKYSLEHYKMLLTLCKADANAQNEVVLQNGKKVSSREEKIENLDNIEYCSTKAMEILDETLISSKIIGQIVKESIDEIEQNAYGSIYYEGFKNPVEDLHFFNRFNSKNLGFFDNLKSKILDNSPEDYDTIPEDYDLSPSNFEPQEFAEVFEKHLAESLVDLTDIRKEVNHEYSPLQQRENECRSLERKQEILKEREKLLFYKDKGPSIGNN